MKRYRKTNSRILELIDTLKKASRENNVKIWKDIAHRLERSSKNWYEVNLFRIDKHVLENDFVIVPGKVLGEGEIHKPVNIAAVSFSKNAEKKIRDANGTVLSIQEMINKNPIGKNVKIIG